MSTIPSGWLGLLIAQAAARLPQLKFFAAPWLILGTVCALFIVVILMFVVIAAAGSGRRRETVTMLAIALVAGGCFLGLVVEIGLRGISVARAAAKTPAHPACENLHLVSLAVRNYQDEYGVFPPAVVTDASGKPLYSGRVLLLPFLGEAALFSQFAKDQPWDSPQNLPLSQTSVKVLQNPLAIASSPGQTDFLFVTGTKTVFEPGRPIRAGNIVDGPHNTMVAVEVKASGVKWAEPSDLDLSQPTPLPPGTNPQGNYVTFADGSVRFVAGTLTPQQIHHLSTRGGREPKIDF